MKQLIIILVIVIAFSSNLFSQNNVDKILSEIEKNNTTLSALRKKVAAEKIGNKTNIYLQNPEIEFNYLWGNPTVIGNRKDISIKQTFDFPTAYGFKNQISDLKNEQSELEFQRQLKSILLQTRFVCIDLIFNNALRFEVSKRLVHAQNNGNAYKLKFEKGDTNILEYNKALLNLLNVRKELESIEIKRKSFLDELMALNGGQFIDFTNSEFDVVPIFSDFEQWYEVAEQNNPVLSWLKKEIEINQTQVKLKRAIGLPKIQAGYMSENVVGQEFQGLTVGLSIPLWENKNKVKYAKANVSASESIAADTRLLFYNYLKALHTKTVSLQNNVNDYRLNLHSFDNSELLKKALDKGEISLTEYILELSIYYESVTILLGLEREMNQSLAELNQYK